MAGNVENIAWTYETRSRPRPALKGLVCFFDEVVDVEIDGERQERGYSPFAKAGSNA